MFSFQILTLFPTGAAATSCCLKEENQRQVTVENYLPRGASGKEPACQRRRLKRRGFDPWVEEIPWRRAWHPTPVIWPGESHGQRSLAGYSQYGAESRRRLKRLGMLGSRLGSSWSTNSRVSRPGDQLTVSENGQARAASGLHGWERHADRFLELQQDASCLRGHSAQESVDPNQRGGPGHRPSSSACLSHC